MVSLTSLVQVTKLGIKSLLLHRLRSVLTTLGMVFGVSSVIAMLAIGEGANYEADQQIRSLGSQNIILRTVKPPEEADKKQRVGSYIINYGLTYDDVTTIRETIDGISVVVEDRKERKTAYQSRQEALTEVVGTVPWYPDLRNRNIERGRFLSQHDMDDGSKVCVIEKELVDELFPIRDPLGGSVRLGRHYFEVVGIMEENIRESKSSNRDKKSGFSLSGNNGTADTSTAKSEDVAEPPMIFIPISTARSLFGETQVQRIGRYFQAEEVELHEVTLRVEKLEQVESISEVIKEQLSRTHDKRDYEVVVPQLLIKQAMRTKRIFNTVLGSIAAISLLVGGIGIMNIMLASVSERTREIGIRRALGARKNDILNQFLVETTILSCLGGILGVALGVTIPFFVGKMTDMVTVVTWWSPVVAFSISGITGIVFGIYPANQAANMSPVEAVRHNN